MQLDFAASFLQVHVVAAVEPKAGVEAVELSLAFFESRNDDRLDGFSDSLHDVVELALDVEVFTVVLQNEVLKHEEQSYFIRNWS